MSARHSPAPHHTRHIMTAHPHDVQAQPYTPHSWPKRCARAAASPLLPGAWWPPWCTQVQQHTHTHTPRLLAAPSQRACATRARHTLHQSDTRTALASLPSACTNKQPTSHAARAGVVMLHTPRHTHHAHIKQASSALTFIVRAPQPSEVQGRRRSVGPRGPKVMPRACGGRGHRWRAPARPHSSVAPNHHGGVRHSRAPGPTHPYTRPGALVGATHTHHTRTTHHTARPHLWFAAAPVRSLLLAAPAFLRHVCVCHHHTTCVPHTPCVTHKQAHNPGPAGEIGHPARESAIIPRDGGFEMCVLARGRNQHVGFASTKTQSACLPAMLQRAQRSTAAAAHHTTQPAPHTDARSVTWGAPAPHGTTHARAARAPPPPHEGTQGTGALPLR
jgi:hypothetical protein